MTFKVNYSKVSNKSKENKLVQQKLITEKVGATGHKSQEKGKDTLRQKSVSEKSNLGAKDARNLNEKGKEIALAAERDNTKKSDIAKDSADELKNMIENQQEETEIIKFGNSQRSRESVIEEDDEEHEEAKSNVD